MPRSTWVPAGVMTWPELTTKEPSGCGPATYVGYGLDCETASAAVPSPAAISFASGLTRLILDFFFSRELFRKNFRDMYGPLLGFFFRRATDWPCEIGVNYEHRPTHPSRESLQTYVHSRYGSMTRVDFLLRIMKR